MKAWKWWALGVALLGAGCGGDDAGEALGGGTAGLGGRGGATALGGVSGMGGAARMGGDIAPALADGQIVAPWDEYCVATFTKDFEAVDSFGDPELSIQAGDRYLLGDPRLLSDAAIIYIADEGPVEFNIDVGGALPFTSSCKDRATQKYVAVFVNTPVCSDAGLTTPVCTLPAGLAVPGGGINYVLSDEGSSPSYEVELKALAAHCSDVAKGFVKAATVTVGGTNSHTGVPIAVVLR